MAAPVYADTSFLVSLYVQDGNTDRAVKAVESGATPLVFTPLIRHELRNALRLCVFRRQISAAQRESALHDVEADTEAGVLHLTPVDWPKAFAHAERLGRLHSETLGTRGMDVLHVACALALRTKRFATFDERQRQLAELAGLEVV
ncbi:MAG: type II toxin-antitoxin system VapC family toxin [Opitutaceae bacterium]|nr:type II toxin-antitoxin system VapC family toxin [Opitutaceae bacterium]